MMGSGYRLRSRAGLLGVLSLVAHAATAPGASAQATEPIDLSIRQKASGVKTGGGEQVLYTIVVRNHGPSDATGVTVGDGERHGGRRLLAVTPSQGTCSMAARTFSCSLGTLVAGGSAQILIRTRASGYGNLTTAAVSGAQPELDPGDNQHQLRLPILVIEPPEQGNEVPDPRRNIDLAIDRRSSARTIAAGQRVTSTIEVVNHGREPARRVTVLDTLNAPATVVSARTTAGSCGRELPMTCRLGTLDPGQRATITVIREHRRAGCWQRSAASVTARKREPITEAHTSDNLDVDEACDRPVRGHGFDVRPRANRRVSSQDVSSARAFPTASADAHERERAAVPRRASR
jgi:uncharacterized repeat protein (TIGR01451 family)